MPNVVALAQSSNLFGQSRMIAFLSLLQTLNDVLQTFSTPRVQRMHLLVVPPLEGSQLQHPLHVSLLGRLYETEYVQPLLSTHSNPFFDRPLQRRLASSHAHQHRIDIPKELCQPGLHGLFVHAVAHLTTSSQQRVDFADHSSMALSKPCSSPLGSSLLCGG